MYSGGEITGTTTVTGDYGKTLVICKMATNTTEPTLPLPPECFEPRDDRVYIDWTAWRLPPIIRCVVAFKAFQELYWSAWRKRPQQLESEYG